MARYFKFKTPDDLAAEAARLGAALSLSEQFEALFQPVKIGTKHCGNRLAIQPMEGCDGTLDGRPDELTFRRYVRFGGGGAKLIWGEATAVSDEGRANPRQLWLHEGSAAAIEEMLARCRRSHRDTFGTDGDFLVGLQLTHSGRYGYRRPMLATHDPLLDPLTSTSERPPGRRVLSVARRRRSEADRRSISSPRRGLPQRSASILSTSNSVTATCCRSCWRPRNRPGQYGGSFENRTRLVRNVDRAHPRRIARAC